ARPQREYFAYPLAQLQRLGRDSGLYNVIIRTDSDIISFAPKMTDGTTPATGGPGRGTIDAILYAGYRNPAPRGGAREPLQHRRDPLRRSQKCPAPSGPAAGSRQRPQGQGRRVRVVVH